MILLDTNVISEPMRRAPDANAIGWIDAQAVETLFLSAITVAELRFGIASLPAGKRRERMRARLEREVLPAFAGRILPFDTEASETYALIMAGAREKGRAIARADGYIAATASLHGLSVATRDTSPFEAAGVAVINPWDESH
ncbi:MAG: type II toxin-antitoxin system VapC family toxin [Rhizobiaceae bacterium]|nr:type II toxin-antitoxin system VapC family toxin [Rhizobiaceae bacterium]MCV0405226.1 type II toxin-antitoxin system VapC family toxin [Rhizobiaceae bacterium]